MGTFVGLVILGSLVTLACRSIYNDRKSGKTCGSCGGNCAKCHAAKAK